MLYQVLFVFTPNVSPLPHLFIACSNYRMIVIKAVLSVAVYFECHGDFGCERSNIPVVLEVYVHVLSDHLSHKRED